MLVMLTASAWAQFSQNYYLTLDPNFEGGASTMIPVSIYSPTFTLTEKLVPTREGNHTFFGWSESPTGAVQYRTNDKITLTGNLTLYAVWEENTNVVELKYTITDEDKRQAELSGHTGNLPGILNIPATVTINGKEYSVTSIGDDAFYQCSNLQSVTIFAPKMDLYGGEAFDNNADDRKIYVFSDCVETYKSSEWSIYANAIEAIPALAVRDAGGELGSWCTYYNGLADVTVAEGTTVYTAKQKQPVAWGLAA